MKKIIVPIDFSTASSNAFAYAKAFAEFTDRPIKVVHITHPETYPETTTIPLEKEFFSKKEKELGHFVKQWREQQIEREGRATLTIEQEVIWGSPTEELIRISRERDSDFIIMGTTGKSGFLKNLLGTISTNVSQKAHCPVWLIPTNASFKGIDNILYAGNYESANEVMLDAIINVSDIFDAVIHLVHVNNPEKNKTDWRFEELMLDKLFKKNAHGFPLELYTIQHDNFWQAINKYVVKQNIDLIAMVTHHRSFWERLSHKSMTKEMLLHAEVPLLILHLEDAVLK